MEAPPPEDDGGVVEEGELFDSVPAAAPTGIECRFATPSPRLTPSWTGGRVNVLARRKWFGCSPLEDFEILDKVGEGTFGEVHKARHKKSGKIVALKKILSRSEQEGFPITALREIKLLKALKHPNIVELLDMASGGGGDSGMICMVFPYMDHDMTGLLEGDNIKFSIPQIKCYMKQLLEGIKYLHKCSILHRDVKGSNILLNNRGELRIADFGLARPLEENRKHYTPGVVTRWYRPPELLYGATEYGPAVDLWGAGCILAEMHTKRPLLPGESDLNQLELVSRLCGTPTEQNMPGISQLPDFFKIRLPTCRRRVMEEFSKFDSMAADLIDKLLVLDPLKRLTAEEALSHPYFKTHPLPSLPQSLPTYEPSHEYDKQKKKQTRTAAPHPTPHEHALRSSSHVIWSPPPPPTQVLPHNHEHQHQHHNQHQYKSGENRSPSKSRELEKEKCYKGQSSLVQERGRERSYISNRSNDDFTHDYRKREYYHDKYKSREGSPNRAGHSRERASNNYYSRNSSSPPPSTTTTLPFHERSHRHYHDHHYDDRNNDFRHSRPSNVRREHSHKDDSFHDSHLLTRERNSNFSRSEEEEGYSKRLRQNDNYKRQEYYRRG